MKFLKQYSWLLAIAAIVFVGFGDKFLPEPLSSASTTTRVTVNNFILGLVPNRRPRTNPYERTEDAVEELESQ